ncbi:MAG: Gldg family protein, partial [Desulfobacterales bacterium]
PEKLKQIIAKLNQTTYDKLEYHYLDPTTDKDAQAKVSQYNIMSLSWPALSDEKIPAGKGVIGLVMSYGDKVQEIRLLDVIRIPILGTQYNLVNPEQLEELLQENLEALIDINEDLGYLADHGTLPAGRSPRMGQQNPEALSSFATLVSRNYTLKPLQLKQDSIPASLNCLVIARPTEKFTDYQLYQIDQALMRGTNLALFVDAFSEITPGQGQPAGFNRGPVYVPLDTGLEKLLEHYGIRIKKSFVLDQNSHMQMLPQAMGGGQRKIYFAPIIKNININHDLEFMKTIKGLITFKMSPLELDASRIAENKLKAIKLIASSKKSWEMRENINLNPLLMGPPPPEAEQQSFPLAYLIKGEFPSFFAGKPIPVKEVEDKDSKDKDAPPKTSQPADLKTSEDLSKVTGEGAFLSKGKPAQILIVGSSEILKDRILDPEGRSPNAMFVMNVLDALNAHADMAVMRSKIQRFNPLLETSAAVKTFIKAFNIAGLPIFVVFFGLFVWLRRHSHKKQIQMMFQE